MTTAITATSLINEMLKRWPFLGFAATADSFGSTYLEDVSEFRSTGYGDEEFRDFYVDLYTMSGNDAVKIATTVDTSTGRLSIGDATGWSGAVTGALPYRLLSVHPDVVRNALATAQQKQYRSTHVLLGVGHDADMELDNANYWDGTSGGSARSGVVPVKGTTYVKSGTQSLYLPYSVAGGYSRGEQIWLDQGQSVYSCHQMLVETGTCTVKLYNATTGQYVNTGNDLAITAKNFGMYERVDSITTSGLYQIEYRGTGSSDKAWIDSYSGLRAAGQTRYEQASWMDNGYNVAFIRPALYSIPISGFSRAWNSDSRYFTGDWQQPQDFFIETFHQEQHPNVINITRGFVPEQPIFIAAQKSLALDEPLTSESSTTTEPQEKVLAYFMAELAKALAGLNPNSKKYADLVKEYTLEESVELLARPPVVAIPPRRLVNRRI